MFEKLEIFRMAHALAVHSGARQAEIAANVANADTPGYRAGDVAPFSEYYDVRSDGTAMRTTRDGHLGAGMHGAAELRRVDLPGEAAPNGNTVALEAEMRKGVEVRYAHESALSIYETARNILRTSLGRGR